jgi:hypothetical protein
MKASCDITIDFKNSEKVRKILHSVSVDDFNFVKSNISGKYLKAQIKSNSISSLINTLDDYLACISVASKIVDKD